MVVTYNTKMTVTWNDNHSDASWRWQWRVISVVCNDSDTSWDDEASQNNSTLYDDEVS